MEARCISALSSDGCDFLSQPSTKIGQSGFPECSPTQSDPSVEGGCEVGRKQPEQHREETTGFSTHRGLPMGCTDGNMPCFLSATLRLDIDLSEACW